MGWETMSELEVKSATLKSCDILFLKNGPKIFTGPKS